MLADGLDQLYGVAIAPGGAIVVAELGAGRVLAIQSGKSRCWHRVCRSLWAWRSVRTARASSPKRERVGW